MGRAEIDEGDGIRPAFNATPALAPALPPSVAQKAAAIGNQTPSAGGNQFGPSGRRPVQQGQPSEQPPPGQVLPGMRGQPPVGDPQASTSPSGPRNLRGLLAGAGRE
jgi:hypothetical protein